MTVFVASKQNKGFPCGSADKDSTCNVGVLGSIPGLGRFPGEGKGYPLQYSGLENPMDYIVPGVSKGRTRLSDFDSLSHRLVGEGTVLLVGSFECQIISLSI